MTHKQWQRKHIADLVIVREVGLWNAISPRPALFPHEAVALMTGAPEMVVFRAFERAAARGLLEYGVSLRTAWLTDKGKALLASGLSETSTEGTL